MVSFRRKKKGKTPRGRSKVKKVMHAFKKGKLKSGKSGKRVTKRKQAIAIALSEQRKKKRGSKKKEK